MRRVYQPRTPGREEPSGRERPSETGRLDLLCLEFWFGLGIGLSTAAGVWSYYQ